MTHRQCAFLLWRILRLSNTLSLVWFRQNQAFDGIVGVQKAEVLKPDIVVIDISLPGLDGIAAAQRILSILPKSKILFLTSHGDPQLVHAALEVGALGFVVKEEAEELLPALEALRHGKRYLSRSVESDAENL